MNIRSKLGIMKYFYVNYRNQIQVYKKRGFVSYVWCSDGFSELWVSGGWNIIHSPFIEIEAGSGECKIKDLR